MFHCLISCISCIFKFQVKLRSPLWLIQVLTMNSNFKIQFIINITKRCCSCHFFLMIDWLVIFVMNIKKTKKIFHFTLFKHIHRKERMHLKNRLLTLNCCTWPFRSSHWWHSAKIGVLQNRCSTKREHKVVTKV